MNKRGVGAAFIGISAFLFGIRALSATAYIVGRAYIKDIDIQLAMPEVRNFAVISAVAGLIYLLWAELEAFFVTRRQ